MSDRVHQKILKLFQHVGRTRNYHLTRRVFKLEQESRRVKTSPYLRFLYRAENAFKTRLVGLGNAKVKLQTTKQYRKALNGVNKFMNI